MALDDLEHQIQTVRDRAAGIQRTYNDELDEVKNNTSLSNEGKKLETQEIYASSKAHLDALRGEENQLIENKITEIERRIDGFVGYDAMDIISFRDAQDRVERIQESADAEQILARAIRTNDRSLAHAVFRRSLDAGWKAPIEQFKKYNPSLAEVADDLNRLQNFKDSWFSRTMAYAALRP